MIKGPLIHPPRCSTRSRGPLTSALGLSMGFTFCTRTKVPGLTCWTREEFARKDSEINRVPALGQVGHIGCEREDITSRSR